MAAFEAMLGATLQLKEGSVSTKEALADKEIVAFYFSSSWCPPCRMFTPKLAEYYNKLKADGKKFEIVFLSSDRDQSSFDGYYGEHHPWLALPFPEREKKASLSSKYRVDSIPTLLFLDREGNMISNKARNFVMADPAGRDFPYVPRPLNELLAGALLKADDSMTSLQEITKSGSGLEYLFLYFSAEWCAPCRMCTAKLAQMYPALKTKRSDFEIIFVSADREQAKYEECRHKMPWVAIPFGDARLKAINLHFEIEGIPSLIVLDKNFKVVNADAVQIAMSDTAEGAGFPWRPPAVQDFSKGISSNGYDINTKPALVAFIENSDDPEQAEVLDILTKVAEEYLAEGQGLEEGPPIIFFSNTTMCEMGKKVREITKLGPVGSSTSPQILLLDIPSQGAFYTYDEEEATEEGLRVFLEEYRAGKLVEKRKQLVRA